MIRAFVCCIVGLMWLNSYSQTAAIKDKHTGEPIGFATLQQVGSSKFVIADAYGHADVSDFCCEDSLLVRSSGYDMVQLDFPALRKQGFVIQLTPDVIELGEVIVSSYEEDPRRQSSLNITPMTLQDIERRVSFSLTDALAAIPGVDQLSSGIGISKPVIRGLYGNRILVLFSGLRFDNQQWQDEHGLGLFDVGISHIELIKGPFSLLYGTEAVGGVINIVEEAPPTVGTVVSDVTTELHSNTLGGTLQFGIKANQETHWYRLRGGVTNHADYSDGNGERVPNSRYSGYYFKASAGFKKPAWQSENHYHFSLNKFGFVFNDFEQYFSNDSRWSRSFSNPHHNVLLNLVSSQNTFLLASSTLKLNLGLQSNFRSEDEGGNELSLRMHLISGQYSLRWMKPISDEWSLVLANSTIAENNTNYGKRKIVPNAWMTESNASAYLKYQRPQITTELGFGAGTRWIKTLLTPSVNSEEKSIYPFSQMRYFANGMLGVSLNPVHKWGIKATAATGVRAPNLAELSSNGLHEGIYTYEIGDPQMKNEQNVNFDLSVDRYGDWLTFGVSGFVNAFDHYIYLQPTTEDWFGFPVYRYQQDNATIYGSEMTMGIEPFIFKNLALNSSYSWLVGKLGNGNYLPYMPARKLKPELRYKGTTSKKWSFDAFIQGNFVARQSLLNEEEQVTPRYILLNTGFGCHYQGPSFTYALSLAGNNLLNEAYYDHLSRYKNFGLLNIGRDVSLTLKITHTKKSK